MQIAPTPAAVKSVMDDYVRSLPQEVRAILPADCRHALDTPLEVQAAAVALLQAELSHRGDKDAGMILHEMAHTFAAASVRLASLQSTELLPPHRS
jgi:hypothetical protein